MRHHPYQTGVDGETPSLPLSDPQASRSNCSDRLLKVQGQAVGRDGCFETATCPPQIARLLRGFRLRGRRSCPQLRQTFDQRCGMNPAETTKNSSLRCIARAQIPKVVLVSAGFFNFLRSKPATRVSMNQNTGQHPSRKEIAACLRLKPESGPPDGTDGVEDLSQTVPLRKACVCITPARIRTQVHS